MVKCTNCDKPFKNELALRMHTNRVHSKHFNKKMFAAQKNGHKNSKRKKKLNGSLTLQDAIIAIQVKRDGMNEVLAILEGLGR